MKAYRTDVYFEGPKGSGNWVSFKNCKKYFVLTSETILVETHVLDVILFLFLLLECCLDVKITNGIVR